MIIEYNGKTGYFDWYVEHLSGRCLTKEKAERHAKIATYCKHLSIKEFHDVKQLLIDVYDCDFQTAKIIKSILGDC